jgi:hypothetical protein
LRSAPTRLKPKCIGQRQQITAEKGANRFGSKPVGADFAAASTILAPTYPTLAPFFAGTEPKGSIFSNSFIGRLDEELIWPIDLTQKKRKLAS